MFENDSKEFREFREFEEFRQLSALNILRIDLLLWEHFIERSWAQFF